ncbi:6-hydroxymethylpterin diphosphokinase MptE-like protein [Aliagarivorans marinus]|uniref:motility associated factor glycosyltransferase family protein n=1 Tax=Aliagarivorans marinus TaxID=561965 RepID=UPI000411EC24|nr:6-hydroxymethylpterin diphosphokinase MptE-like protein [Aliagarivorans marinus]
MLNSVNAQLHSDEARQQELEQQFSGFIKRSFQQNINALSQLSTDLASAVGSHQLQEHSPVITKTRHVNISNYLKGTCLYHSNPEKQVTAQVERFSQRALRVDCSEKYPEANMDLSKPGALVNEYIPALAERYAPLSDDSDTLVILGCGLGLHIPKLLALKPWKRVLIVEPSLDLLHCSLYGGKWQDVLRRVSNTGCALDFIVGEEGVANNHALVDWCDTSSVSHFVLYRHYNYAAFNTLEFGLATGHFSLAESSKASWTAADEDRHFECENSLAHYLNDETDYSLPRKVASYKSRLQKNLAAFKTSFPSIAEAFESYDSEEWCLFSQPNGNPNLFNIRTGAVHVIYDAVKEYSEYFDYYCRSPRMDTLDARKVFRKPSPFIHFEYSDRLRDLVQSLPDVSSQVPKKVPSFIMYGLGMGYYTERILLDYQVDNFILYEPSWDFFFASLMLIDWAEIMKRAEESESNLYLNIGDDGTNMYKDIHRRFQFSGMHILSYTFFFVGYYSQSMAESLKNTREQLKVFLNISEYFDHCFYNITHTNACFRDKCYLMLKDKSEQVEKLVAETPVFVIGNGPSIDNCIDVIRSNQNKAIIVSCGTSLKALYNLGIKPDFHAEVEQTNATAQWISQVPDRKWLKQIALLSVCGVHPNVVELFDDCYLGMKLGEASTATYNAIKPSFKKFQGIYYSYPTVSNCALASVLKLGFKQIYLFGVDLGFKDPDSHHSRHSAYYKADGKQLYNYSAHGTGFRVPGNFTDYVFTKHEFKFAAEVMGQTLAEEKGVECYNTSDGAFIEGTVPLRPENVLLVNDVVDKAGFLELIKNQAYDRINPSIVDEYDVNYIKDHYLTHYDKLEELWSVECESWSQVLDLIAQHNEILQNSSSDISSLFFVLNRGSASFSMSYLTRLAFSSENEQECMIRFSEGVVVWREYLREMRDFYIEHYGDLDNTLLLGFNN